jgi:hypothetical protein
MYSLLLSIMLGVLIGVNLWSLVLLIDTKSLISKKPDIKKAVSKLATDGWLLI